MQEISCCIPEYTFMFCKCLSYLIQLYYKKPVSSSFYGKYFDHLSINTHEMTLLVSDKKMSNDISHVLIFTWIML